MNGQVVIPQRGWPRVHLPALVARVLDLPRVHRIDVQLQPGPLVANPRTVRTLELGPVRVVNLLMLVEIVLRDHLTALGALHLAHLLPGVLALWSPLARLSTSFLRPRLLLFTGTAAAAATVTTSIINDFCSTFNLDLLLNILRRRWRRRRPIVTIVKLLLQFDLRRRNRIHVNVDNVLERVLRVQLPERVVVLDARHPELDALVQQKLTAIAHVHDVVRVDDYLKLQKLYKSCIGYSTFNYLNTRNLHDRFNYALILVQHQHNIDVGSIQTQPADRWIYLVWFHFFESMQSYLTRRLR